MKQKIYFWRVVTWGYGNNDSNTIPSHYSLISKEKVKIRRKELDLDQDLAYLIQQYNQSKIFSNVFFIFGINDIYIKCLSGNLFAHGEEEKIRNQLNKRLLIQHHLKIFFQFLKNII